MSATTKSARPVVTVLLLSAHWMCKSLQHGMFFAKVVLCTLRQGMTAVQVCSLCSEHDAVVNSATYNLLLEASVNSNMPQQGCGLATARDARAIHPGRHQQVPCKREHRASMCALRSAFPQPVRNLSGYCSTSHAMIHPNYGSAFTCSAVLRHSSIFDAATRGSLAWCAPCSGDYGRICGRGAGLAAADREGRAQARRARHQCALPRHPSCKALLVLAPSTLRPSSLPFQMGLCKNKATHLYKEAGLQAGFVYRSCQRSGVGPCACALTSHACPRR